MALRNIVKVGEELSSMYGVPIVNKRISVTPIALVAGIILIMFIKNKLPDDVLVFLVMHEETNDYGDTKLKTIGKLLDQKVCVEGLVTVCLRAMKEGTNKYFFRTQSDGADVSKSPENLFDLQIDNDLKMVDDAIRSYWGL